MSAAVLYAMARPFLFALDPEDAHAVTMRVADSARQCGLLGLMARRPPSQPFKLMGLEFSNPVGLAAGLDKDARHVDLLSALGFGFIELGGVTPRPQPGNPRPRMFRIPEAQAIINRFGLNSVGVDAFVENLRRSSRRTGPLGVNIGKNRDTPNVAAAEDYERCLDALYPHIDYVSINVSSPNTRGLRELQSGAALEALLVRMHARRERLREKHGRHVALVPKIAPDLDDDAVRTVADVIRRQRMDGVIATNTTVLRTGIEQHSVSREEGGLSGAPLRERATHIVSVLARALAGELPVIGVGGILSGTDAADRVSAGAALVQVYTGLIYRGPALITECVKAITARQRS